MMRKTEKSRQREKKGERAREKRKWEIGRGEMQKEVERGREESWVVDGIKQNQAKRII